MSSRRTRQFPAAIGERAAARSGLLGLAARCVARLGTRQHAFENDRDAEQRESEVKGGDGVLAPGALTIGPNIFILAGNSERVEIVAEQALIMIGRDVVADTVVGQIGERVAERGQFPVENADHPRLGGMEHQVVEAEIAVADGGLVTRRNMPRQPFGEPVDRGVLARLRVLPLPRPAVDLTNIVVSWSSKLGKSNRLPIDQMQPRKRLVHAEIDRTALLAREFRQRWRPKDAALEALHQIE